MGSKLKEGIKIICKEHPEQIATLKEYDAYSGFLDLEYSDGKKINVHISKCKAVEEVAP